MAVAAGETLGGNTMKAHNTVIALTRKAMNVRVEIHEHPWNVMDPPEIPSLPWHRHGSARTLLLYSLWHSMTMVRHGTWHAVRTANTRHHAMETSNNIHPLKPAAVLA